MTPWDVEQIAGPQIRRAWQLVTDRWQFRSVMDRRQFQTTGNETRAIHPRGVGAHRRIVRAALRGRRDIARRRSICHCHIERCRTIEPAPFVGNPLVHHSRDPPAFARLLRLMPGVRGVHQDARLVLAMQDISRKWPPRMGCQLVGDRHRFRRRQLRRRGRISGDQRFFLRHRRFHRASHRQQTDR